MQRVCRHASPFLQMGVEHKQAKVCNTKVASDLREVIPQACEKSNFKSSVNSEISAQQPIFVRGS